MAEALDRFRTEAAARLRELWQRLDDLEQQALRDSLGHIPTQRLSLRMRGLVTEEGTVFGKVLTEWLREEM